MTEKHDRLQNIDYTNTLSLLLAGKYSGNVLLLCYKLCNE
jgi:hypothetical protein